MAASGRMFHHPTKQIWVSIANRTSTSTFLNRWSQITFTRRLWSTHNVSYVDDHGSHHNNGVGRDVDLEHIRKHYRVRRRGQRGHGSREYLLLPPDIEVDELPPRNSESTPIPVVAALLAHRNILFGARAFLGFNVEQVCVPLVQEAVREAEEYGEQPQAMAALKGLSAWVEACLHGQIGEERNEDEASIPTNGTTINTTSQTLIRLKEADSVAWEAVRAIATGIPRPGHSVVGAGTFRDGEEAWKALAREYVELGLAPEANLYRKEGARLVAIEHLADRNPAYLESAGGAMARLFFL